MKRLLVVLLVTGLLFAGAFASAQGTITVGSKEFTEQIILGNIMKILLEENGYSVDDRIGMGGTLVAREALEHGQIDVYMEYTGTALMVFFKYDEVITDPEEAYNIAAREDLENKNLVWLEKLNFDNTYTLMMRQESVNELGIKTISDLAVYVKDNPGEINFATNAEFYARPDGYPALEETYGFEFPRDKIIKLDSGLTYKALQEGQVDVAMGFATDGRIAGYNLVNLVDDKQFFPVYNPAPVIRKEVLDENPEVRNLLNQIGPSLDSNTMTRMNYLVDIEHMSEEDVARNWLKGVGLIN